MTDMINRQELIAHLNECIVSHGIAHSPLIDAVLTAVKCAVEQMPTVEKCGEWERHPDFLHIRSANIHRCSLCKERPLYRMGNEVLSAFCPSCGAKMKG